MCEFYNVGDRSVYLEVDSRQHSQSNETASARNIDTNEVFLIKTKRHYLRGLKT